MKFLLSFILLFASFLEGAAQIPFHEDTGLSIGVKPAGVGSVDMDYGDLNGDGSLDLVIVHLADEGEQIEFYVNTGDHHFRYAKGIEIETAKSTAVKLGDLDNDGDLDVVVARFSGNNRIYLNQGDLVFKNKGGTFGHTKHTIHDLHLADMNHDGFLDIIVAYHKGRNEIWLNDQSAKFKEVHHFGHVLSPSYHMEVGDLNKDGFLDVVEVNAKGHKNWMYLSKGAKLHYAAVGFSHPNVDSRAVEVADLNYDGNPDILIGNYKELNQVFYLNEKAEFIDTLFFGGSNEKTSDISVVDMNNEGKLDILCAHMGTANSIFFGTDTHKKFIRQDLNEHVFNTSAILGLDLNGDGLMDIAETNLNHRNVYYTQDALPIKKVPEGLKIIGK